MSLGMQVVSVRKQTGPQRMHKVRHKIGSHGKCWLHRLTIFELLCDCFCVFFFFQAQNIPLCPEKLAHRFQECNLLTDPLNLSTLALPTCTQCVPILLLLLLLLLLLSYSKLLNELLCLCKCRSTLNQSMVLRC